MDAHVERALQARQAAPVEGTPVGASSEPDSLQHAMAQPSTPSAMTLVLPGASSHPWHERGTPQTGALAVEAAPRQGRVNSQGASAQAMQGSAGCAASGQVLCKGDANAAGLRLPAQSTPFAESVPPSDALLPSGQLHFWAAPHSLAGQKPAQAYQIAGLSEKSSGSHAAAGHAAASCSAAMPASAAQGSYSSGALQGPNLSGGNPHRDRQASHSTASTSGRTCNMQHRADRHPHSGGHMGGSRIAEPWNSHIPGGFQPQQGGNLRRNCLGLEPSVMDQPPCRCPQDIHPRVQDFLLLLPCMDPPPSSFRV